LLREARERAQREGPRRGPITQSKWGMLAASRPRVCPLLHSVECLPAMRPMHRMGAAADSKRPSSTVGRANLVALPRHPQVHCGHLVESGHPSASVSASEVGHRKLLPSIVISSRPLAASPPGLWRRIAADRTRRAHQPTKSRTTRTTTCSRPHSSSSASVSASERDGRRERRGRSRPR